MDMYNYSKNATPDQKRARYKQYYNDNKERMQKTSNDSYKKRKAESPWAFTFRGTKGSAKRRGIEFNLTEEYIKSIWTDTCPILGIPLTCNKGTPKDNSYSLDRIDNTKGYVEGNVMVISYRANAMKHTGTAEEHLKIANYLMLLEAEQKGSSAA